MVSISRSLDRFFSLSMTVLLVTCFSGHADAAIKGHIDRVEEISGHLRIRGWACDTGISRSANIHVYVGGRAGQGGTFVGSKAANSSNEIGVNRACSTTGSSHRFIVDIPKRKLLNHRNKTIYVHGISLSNGSNLIIGRSGNFRIPNFEDQRPQGYVSAPVASGSNIIIRGWACQRRHNRSLRVSILVNGSHPNSGGVTLKSVTANVSHERAVTERCGTSGVKHRFQATIPKSSVFAHVRKRFYARAWSQIPGYYSNLLRHSGSSSLPNFAIPLSSLPRQNNGDIIIPSGTEAFVDRSLTLGVLHIHGELKCQPTVTRTLNVQGVMVSGKLLCGSSSSRVSGKMTFNIRRGRALSMMGHSMGQRTFAVMNGGEVEMYGQLNKAYWVRLKRTASRGTRIIKVTAGVGWQVGDRIGIAPTDYDVMQSEERTITRRISSTEFELNAPLSHTHYGSNHTYSRGGRSWTLKSSAEVGNMTRNIVIKTADVQTSPESAKYIGAHMMVMRGGSAKIDGVEFDRMGQAGEMARYPFHWHLAKNVAGQFIKNSSIHHSFQRCITVHGTDRALVHNNFCYEHRGHGIFLEDGNELYNQISNNLVMKSLRAYPGRELLESDRITANGSGIQSRRFVPPSAFWIAHPANNVQNNVSAGSQGTGFWMSFEQRNICDRIDGSRCVVPAMGATNRFNNNVAKGNFVGITWDGAKGTRDANNPNNEEDTLITSSHYHSPNIPTMTGNQAMKGMQSCFYTRTNTMNFDNTVTSDCGWHHFHAFNIRLNNSLMIGDGPFPRTDFTKRKIADNAGNGHYGIVLYDGPFELNNVHFRNFSTSNLTYNASNGQSRSIASIPIGKIGGANKYTNRSRGLSFSPEPYKRLDFFKGGANWEDWHVSQSLLDIDGTLTGETNALVTVKNSFNKTTDCFNKNDWNAIVCDADRYKIGNLVIHDYSPSARANGTQNKFYFNSIRHGVVESHPSLYPNVGRKLHSKVNLLTNTNQFYEIDVEGQSMDDKTLRYHTHRAGEKSNVIRIINPQTNNCRVSGAQRVYSMSQLLNASGSAYYRYNEELRVRIKPNQSQTKFTGAIRNYYRYHDVVCN